jgi:hypothetical protein
LPPCRRCHSLRPEVEEPVHRFLAARARRQAAEQDYVANHLSLPEKSGRNSGWTAPPPGDPQSVER